MARPTWNVSFYQVGRCTPCRTRHTFTWSSAPWRLGGVGRKLIWSQTVEYVCVCAQPDGNDFCRSPWSRHHWFDLILCVCVLSTSSFSSSLPFQLALKLLLSQDRFNRQKKWERLEETGVEIGTAKRKDGKVDFFFGEGGERKEEGVIRLSKRQTASDSRNFRDCWAVFREIQNPTPNIPENFKENKTQSFNFAVSAQN